MLLFSPPPQLLDWEDVCGRCEAVAVSAHIALLGVGQERLGALIRDVGISGLPDALYRRVGAAMARSERFQEVSCEGCLGAGGAV